MKAVNKYSSFEELKSNKKVTSDYRTIVEKHHKFEKSIKTILSKTKEETLQRSQQYYGGQD